MTVPMSLTRSPRRRPSRRAATATLVRASARAILRNRKATIGLVLLSSRLVALFPGADRAR